MQQSSYCSSKLAHNAFLFFLGLMVFGQLKRKAKLIEKWKIAKRQRFQKNNRHNTSGPFFSNER